jgi:carboxyl-terminal processing protease
LCIIKDKEKQKTLRDPNRGMIYTGPMIVMVNTFSASASELTAAALQDHNRALIVGSPTYGKGTAQILEPLPIPMTEAKDKPTDFIKATREKFYRIKGNTVQWTGVIPDVKLPDEYQLDELREKHNPTALIPDTCKKAYFTPMQPIPSAQLQELSAKRVAQSSFFKRMADINNYLKKRKDAITLDLKLSNYASSYEEQEKEIKEFSDKEDDGTANFIAINHSFDKDRFDHLSKETRELNDAWLKRIGHDMYISEACSIMLDWLSLNH